MLKVKAVAKRLDVSQACVYELIAEGRLLCHRIGVGRGTIRISEDQLKAYLEESATGRAREEKPPPPPKPKLKLQHIDLG